MGEHTPTPWATNKDWPLFIVRIGDERKGNGCSTYEHEDRECFFTPIAHTAGQEHFAHDISKEEALANAAFIVRAVNSRDALVKALEVAIQHVMLDVFDGRDGKLGNTKESNESLLSKAEANLELCRAALALAREGEGQ